MKKSTSIFSMIVNIFNNALLYTSKTNSNQKFAEHFERPKSNPAQEYHEFNHGTIIRIGITRKKNPS